MSGQKLPKNAKNRHFGQTVLPDMSFSIRQKLLKNANVEKFK